MMLTKLFPKYPQRYTGSRVASWLIDFAEWLVAVGYSPNCARGHICRLKLVLESRRSIAFDAKFSSDELAVAFEYAKQRYLFRGTQRVFERFLVARGQLVYNSEPIRFSGLLDAYERHLTEVRGLAALTIRAHIATVTAFLAQAIPPRASLQELSRKPVEEFVVSVGRRVKRQSLQHPISQLRAFLRYCHDQGVIRERLDSIDVPRTYRDELPPRALKWCLVQQLLSSIDRSCATGWRDYVILHLMSHYGLRPSEIVGLTRDSVDLETGTLHVEQIKTRSSLDLPLGDRTVRLLKRYLRCGRAQSIHPNLFLRVRCPTGPIERTAINNIYEKRVHESGLPLQGTSAYCLRHTFAMRLLDRGVGIKAIGDLLGHRPLESTCVYLRIQVEALRVVALPVPCAPSNVQGGSHVSR